MPKKTITIKPLTPGDRNKINAALALLESLVATDWAESCAQWRHTSQDRRTAEAAPLFNRFVVLAQKVL